VLPLGGTPLSLLGEAVQTPTRSNSIDADFEHSPTTREAADNSSAIDTGGRRRFEGESPTATRASITRFRDWPRRTGKKTATAQTCQYQSMRIDKTSGFLQNRKQSSRQLPTRPTIFSPTHKTQSLADRRRARGIMGAEDTIGRARELRG